MRFIICGMLLAVFCLISAAEAEKICVKNSVRLPVQKGKVVVRMPRLIQTAEACPRGSTEITDLALAPSGSTMTGVWNLSGKDPDWAPAEISFPRRLSSAPQVEFVAAGGTGTQCTGSVAEPTAPAGYLCIYEAYQFNLRGDFRYRYWTYNPVTAESSTGVQASVYGAAMYGYPEASLSEFYSWGTWAVTAP